MTESNVEQAVVEAKEQAEQPVRPAEHVPEGFEHVPPNIRETGGATTRLLVETRDSFRLCLGAMVASRQLYAMAVRDLDECLASCNEASRRALVTKAVSLMENPPGAYDPLEAFEVVSEIMIQAAANKAAQPFHEKDLFRSFSETVFPWMLAVAEKHNQLDAERHQADLTEEDTLRRARDVPIGIKWDHEAGSQLPRKQSLVLVGWKPAVLWVLDQIMTATLAARDAQSYYVLRFSHTAPRSATETQPQLLRLGDSAWKDCAIDNQSVTRLLHTYVLDRMTAPVDLWIVDDLAHAMTRGLSHGVHGRSSGDAHKQIRKSATDLGAALVAGVLLPTQELPNLAASSHWEQLRNYSTLRAVSVKEVDDNYKITVGNNLEILTVEKKLLDNYGGSTLILPEGI